MQTSRKISFAIVKSVLSSIILFSYPHTVDVITFSLHILLQNIFAKTRDRTSADLIKVILSIFKLHLI